MEAQKSWEAQRPKRPERTEIPQKTWEAQEAQRPKRPKRPEIPQRPGRPKRPNNTESQLIRCYHYESPIPTETFRSNHLKRRPINGRGPKGISSFVKCVKIVLLQLQNCANIEKDITNLGFICEKCDNSATPYISAKAKSQQGSE